MIELTGNSLSKRQQELNTKVNEAAASGVNFDEVSAEKETSDVDRLFKIDLAAKNMKIDYIIETLKSGDPVYISRALKKALWLYDDEWSNIINADYLHHNVFPYMSIKMKKKFLKAISLHVKNEDITEAFYNYCVQVEMTHYANKFVLNTTESFKLKLLQTSFKSFRYDHSNYTFLKNFLGDSFLLFEEYLKHVDNYRICFILNMFSYFYSICATKYLDLLESNVQRCPNFNSSNWYKSDMDINFGLRVSKDIVTKHKSRVLANPKLYVNILKISKLLRHSNSNDLKVYASGVLPDQASQFWDMQYYKKFKPIIHAIPECERYAIIKNVFEDKYTHDDFEMTKEFYIQNYHYLMTETEKETWALRHIENDTEVVDDNFTWYRFVSFDIAFMQIKKLTKTATDHMKRIALLKVLIQSAKSHRDLEKLLEYYYERHLNERRFITDAFLKEIVSAHNVLEFDRDCWEAFSKMLSVVEVYYMTPTKYDDELRVIAIVRHIIDNKEMPEALQDFIVSKMHVPNFYLEKYTRILNEEKKQRVYTFIYNVYFSKIQDFIRTGEDSQYIPYIHLVLDLMHMFDKKKNDIPEIIMGIVNSKLETFSYKKIFQDRVPIQDSKNITNDDLIRYLKKDAKLVTEKVSEVHKSLTVCYFRLNGFLRKLKIYFSGHEVTQRYLKYFNDIIAEDSKNHGYEVVRAAVYGFFILSDEKSIIDFMNKFAPPTPKVDYGYLFHHLSLIREGICRFACYSRPPVPLSSMLMYLKGDYVRYCLPMFHMFFANLPQPLCAKFIASLLNTPVSIQKHGLRLAFKSFNTENLRNLTLNAWKGTKNVSLRSVIYRAFFEKTLKDQNKEMFEVLRVLTLDLNNDDDEEIFDLIQRKRYGLCASEAVDFIEALWVTVQKLNDTRQKLLYKIMVIELIEHQQKIMNKSFVAKIVADYLMIKFPENKSKINLADGKFSYLHTAKWDLTISYIVRLTGTEDRSDSIDMTKFIVGKCLEAWNDVDGESYVYRQIYEKFVRDLKYSILKYLDSNENIQTKVIFETILKDLQAALPLHGIYLYVWDLRIIILGTEAIKQCKMKFKTDNRLEVFEESLMEYGKQLGYLVKEFVQNGIYFSYFQSIIVKLVNKLTSDFYGYLDRRRTESLKLDRASLIIARGMLQAGTVETDLLALHTVPADLECSLYDFAYSEIRNLSDIEVKCCLYEKCKRKRID